MSESEKEKSSPFKLQRWAISCQSGDGISRTDALITAHNVLKGEGCGMAYTPKSVVLFRLGVAPGQLEFSDDRKDVDDGYELRIFSAAGELRWLQSGDSGSAAFVTDSDQSAGADVQCLAAWQAQDSVSIDNGHRLEQYYLLWGEENGGPRDGWTDLTANRIGTLTVPYELKIEKDSVPRIRLQYYEYIGPDTSLKNDHGNMAVVAHRLAEFDTHPKQSH